MTHVSALVHKRTDAYTNTRSMYTDTHMMVRGGGLISLFLLKDSSANESALGGLQLSTLKWQMTAALLWGVHAHLTNENEDALCKANVKHEISLQTCDTQHQT